jgi:hypothetical protein
VHHAVVLITLLPKLVLLDLHCRNVAAMLRCASADETVAP